MQPVKTGDRSYLIYSPAQILYKHDKTWKNHIKNFGKKLLA